jgi:Leucine-rich repeat (LRR) protein
MWISEGFIQPPDESSSHEYGLEEMATEYYKELIKRNLIEPTEGYSITAYRCTMHDVVRSFAEYMAREESAVVVDDKQVATCGGGGGMLVRRLSVGQTVSVVEWATLQRMKSLRTLIINSSIKFQNGGDSLLGSFSSLRVLYIWSADSDRLVASLSNLKHLRLLHLEGTDVSKLPDDIQQMKFLQFINLLYCENLGQLPSSMIKLVHLRSLDITGTNVSVVPKGFGGLTNLRSLYGFPIHVDNIDHSSSTTSSWCSLQELAPLSQLRQLTLHGLEKVPASTMAEKAFISSKGHLIYIEFNYNSAGGGGVEQQQQQSVIQEEVLEKLCPPTSSLENLTVKGGYAGRQFPTWMHAPASAVDFKSLRFLRLENLPCYTQLPEGLCCLPCLEMLNIEDAPTVKRIGPEFQAPSSSPDGDTVVATLAPPPFPKLRVLQLIGLCEWEEWEWNDDGSEQQKGSAKATMAMPYLEILTIDNCKLCYLPPGLANSKRHALKELYLYKLTNLSSVENFPSVVELDVFDCPELKRISGLSRLHKIRIIRCPKLEELEGVPVLDSLTLYDGTMETLPSYLTGVSPRYLSLSCNKKLYGSLSSQGSSEFNKISHIGKHDIDVIED